MLKVRFSASAEVSGRGVLTALAAVWAWVRAMFG